MSLTAGELEPVDLLHHKTDGSVDARLIFSHKLTHRIKDRVSLVTLRPSFLIFGWHETIIIVPLLFSLTSSKVEHRLALKMS